MTAAHTTQQTALPFPAPGAGATVVLGAPGTGKSTFLVDLAIQRIEQGSLDPAGLLLLAPSRAASERLRNRLTDQLARTLSAPPARTWTSYAFDLIRRAKVEGRLPHIIRPPRLLSGAEQDLLIKELLAGHGAEGAPDLRWPDSLSAALDTRGFRQEIRELFDRVSEYGASADELETWGVRFSRPDWVSAARLYREYRDIVDLRMPEAFDPAGILTGARELLENDPEFLDAERQRLGLILVDDYQEANPAIHALLGLLARGKDVVVTSCPDSAVQGFRGARPDLTGTLSTLLDDGRTPVATVVLPRSYRLKGHLLGAWQRVAARISTTGSASYRAAVCEEEREVPVGSHVVESSFHELRYVAQRILHAHLFDRRGLDEIAVIVRNGDMVDSVQRFLATQGIAANVPAAETAMRDEPAVRPLLDVFAVVLGEVELEPELCVRLLSSRIGGTRSLELRRLRQALRYREREAGGGRPSDELLAELFSLPEAADLLPREASGARRIIRMIAAGRSALKEPGADPESVLWAIWAASGLAQRWADAAVGGGPLASRADRDLDAMMALFHAAERFVDQMPAAPPALFLDYLLSQELPMDTLARRSEQRASVSVLTPASAAGRQWPVVIIAGLQEGTWPNLRLRGELLGSGELRALMDYGESFRSSRDPLSLVQEIRFDELRTFSAAISRAEEELICIGVSSPDAQPSQFLDLVDPLPPESAGRPRTEVDRPLTPRALVSELRRYAQDAERYPDLAREARLHLARMDVLEPHLAGAGPAEWWGVLPLTSTDPVIPDSAVIPVSPSKVESVIESPLNWFVSAAGGEPTTDFARSLGTLVHQLAHEYPDATGTEYARELARRWPSLGIKDGWEGALELRRAETMVRKLAAYVIAARQDGRSLHGTEVDFEVDLPVAVRGEPRVARLRGQIDRLETDASGRLVVVDLKTGKTAPAAKAIDRHAQLAAYQVAVLRNAFGAADAGGAALVQLGTTNKTHSVQEQPPVDPGEGWAEEMISQAANLMASAVFETIHDPLRAGFGGSGCRLPEICPLCTEGRQVTQ